MLDDDDSPSLTAPLGDVIKGLIAEARKALPDDSECEVEIGGSVERVIEGEGKAGVKFPVFELSLGGKGSHSTESNFSLKVKFPGPSRNNA